MLEVRVNGTVRALEDGSSVLSMLEQLGLATDGVAVEVNREIVPRRLHPETRLEAGDEVEIVTLVGGG